MRKYSFSGVEISLCVAMLFATMFSAQAFSADNPLDVVKKLISDDSDKKNEESKPQPTKLSEPTDIGKFCAISGFDGSLRIGRCNGSLGDGIFIVPTSDLGGKITEGMVVYKNHRYPVTTIYNDVESGVSILFTSAKTGINRLMATGQFPEAGTKVLVNSSTPINADVRDIYGLGLQKAVQISGESDEDNFVGYEISDSRGKAIGVIISGEQVYNDARRADICYVLPSAYITHIAGKAFKEKKVLPKQKDGVLTKITPAELDSFSEARRMLYLRRYPQAIKRLRKLLGTAPINAYAYRQLGDMYFEQHDFQRASECYRKAIELQSGLLGCYPRMGQSMGKIGQPDKALDILLKCSKQIKGEEMTSTFAEAFRLIGLDLIKENQPAKAVVALQNADRLNPGDAEISFALAEALMDADQLKESRKYYSTFLRLAGPAWREYTLSSPPGGDVVMDPRAMRAQRRIDEIDYKLRMRATQK